MCSVVPMVEILSYFSKDLPQVTVQAPHSSLVIRGLCPYTTQEKNAEKKWQWQLNIDELDDGDDSSNEGGSGDDDPLPPKWLRVA